MRKRIDRPSLVCSALARAAADDGATAAAAAAAEAAARQLTIYSSLPLQGAARAQSVAAVNGAKLALEQAGGKAGKFPIKYKSLDDSTAQAGGWEPGATSANARKAAGDEVDDRLHRRVQLRRHGGLAADPQRGRRRRRSARATPRSASPPTTRARSPASRTSTTRPASAPTRACCPRTPTRAPRSPRWPRRRAAPRPTSSTTRRSTARAWPRTSSSSAKKIGLEIKGDEGIDKNAANYRSLAPEGQGAPAPQCFIYSGITANNAVQIFKDMAVALPERAAARARGRRRDRLLRSQGGRPARPTSPSAR